MAIYKNRNYLFYFDNRLNSSGETPYTSAKTLRPQWPQRFLSKLSILLLVLFCRLWIFIASFYSIFSIYNPSCPSVIIASLFCNSFTFFAFNKMIVKIYSVVKLFFLYYNWYFLSINIFSGDAASTASPVFSRQTYGKNDWIVHLMGQMY